ncbi:MAG: hypothetical protein FWG13_02510 [Leptospirales bacterium]|nr:hypothetical protein [Leptospirales bacterium]
MQRGAFLFFFCLVSAFPLTEISAGLFYPLASELKIGILSKYAPVEIALSGEQGIIFAGERKYDIPGKAIFRASGSNVIVSGAGGQPLAEGARVKVFFPDRYTVHIDQDNASFSRVYSGNLEISSEGGALVFAAIIKTAEYARATAKSELGDFLSDRPADAYRGVPGWKNELVSAVETAVCSYIAAQKDRHPEKSYDFCDLTHCANFQGLSHLPEKRRDLLKIMIGSDGKPVSGFFHTACGGILNGPESYWGGAAALNFRRGAEDFCAASNDFNWSVSFTASQLEALTGAAGLEDVTAEYRDGRVGALLFSAKNGSRRMGASLFLSRAGFAFGWNKIRSNLFSVKKDRDGWNFTGRGFGHGIGLCMWGARRMAMEGKSAADILNFFYANPHIALAE